MYFNKGLRHSGWQSTQNWQSRPWARGGAWFQPGLCAPPPQFFALSRAFPPWKLGFDVGLNLVSSVHLVLWAGVGREVVQIDHPVTFRPALVAGEGASGHSMGVAVRRRCRLQEKEDRREDDAAGPHRHHVRRTLGRIQQQGFCGKIADTGGRCMPGIASCLCRYLPKRPSNQCRVY